MAENEEQKNQKQDQNQKQNQGQNQGQNPNQGQYYLKLVAQGCFYFLDDSDEKTDEKIAGLYTQGAGPCACIIVKNQDNTKMVLAHVGDNNSLSNEQTGLKHWIDLVSNHGQENVQVEVHLGCGRGGFGNAEKNESGYNDWFNRVKKVLQNQSIDGKKLYTLCKKNENNGAENTGEDVGKKTGETARKHVLKTVEEIEGEAAEKVIIKQPIGNTNYNFINETGIILRKGYHLSRIKEEKSLNTNEKKQYFKITREQNQNLEQAANQNPKQRPTVIFNDKIGDKIHAQSNVNMTTNAITIQDQLDKKLNQLVQQRYQKYLKSEAIKISEVTKISEAIKISKPVEITEITQKNANLKVPLTDQGEIDELNYENELGESDFQQHPKYFTQVNRYQIDELKLFQELGKSGKLNREGERKLKRLELFKTHDDMNLAFKSGWRGYIENRQNQTRLKIEQNIQKDHLGVKNRPNQTSLQRSNSCRF